MEFGKLKECTIYSKANTQITKQRSIANKLTKAIKWNHEIYLSIPKRRQKKKKKGVREEHREQI